MATTTIPQFAGSFYIDFDGTHYCAMHGSQQMFKRNGSLAEYKSLTGAIKYFAEQCIFPPQACCTCGEMKSVNAEGECEDCASLEPIVEETTQEPEQVVEAAKPETTKTETRYRVRVKTFSGEIKVYLAKYRKDADAIFSKEVRWDCLEENMYVQLEDSGRERVEYKVIESCDLTKKGHSDPSKKPQLTDSTVTYTIVERNEQGKSPFFARVLVPSQEVQDFDPIRHDEWWKHTKSDLVFAINKEYKGAWRLKPEEFEARVSEQAKPTIEDITPEQLAEIMPFAQEYREHKQADMATFAAETKLETVQVQEEPYTLTCAVCGYKETRDKNKTYQGVPRHCNKAMKVDFSEWESTPKQPKTFILREEAHPLKANASIYRAYYQNEDGTVGQPCYIGAESIEEVERRLRASENVATIVVIPLQSELTDKQRNAILAQRRAESEVYLAHMDQETQAYIQEEIANSQIQQQVELQHKERIITMDNQSFWKPGSIVKLQQPYKPSEPPDALLKAIAGTGSTYHQMIEYDKWHGFTHGIIAQVYAHDHAGNVSNVSLHLYDPEIHVIYIDNAVGIPTYVDYHISELTPYKDGSLVGYEVIRS